MRKFLYLLLIHLFFSEICIASDSLSFYPPQNRVLVISGGGARGAWGVGVCKALLEKYKGYKAVYGTSTGSLMAPLILLQNIPKLEYNYTHVTQKDIFNLSPFKLKKKPIYINGQPLFDSFTNTQIYHLKTEIKGFNAFWRLLWGKSTVGKSDNLLSLIRKELPKEEYDILKQLCFQNGMEIGVGVTNMRTGKFEMIKNTDLDYLTFTNFMWASANQPVWMSYYYDEVKKSYFVDGGLVEVLPIREAIEFAKRKGIDTIDVVLNNSLNFINPKDFTIDKSYLSGGLIRLLETYGQATLSNNIELGRLKAKLHACGYSEVSEGSEGAESGFIHINIYSMNPSLASLYKDELGFDKEMMSMILKYGYASTKRKLGLTEEVHESPILNSVYESDLKQVKLKKSSK